MTATACRHCGQRIVRVRFALGERWVHQPAGAAFGDGQHEFCKTTVAEPMPKIEPVTVIPEEVAH